MSIVLKPRVTNNQSISEISTEYFCWIACTSSKNNDSYYVLLYNENFNSY